MTSKVIYDADQEKLFSQAAEILISQLAEVKNRPAVLGLCGGRSVVGILKAIAEKAASYSTLLKNIHFFMVDERVVPLDHADSNFKLLKSELFDGLVSDGIVNLNQIHPFQYAGSSDSEAEKNYQDELSKFGGKFDACVLGSGEDGHIGGLFPKHPALAIKESKFIIYHGSPKPPQHRMSASLPLIANSKTILLLVLGEAKKQAYRNYCDASIDITTCPSKVVDLAPNGVVFTNINRDS